MKALIIRHAHREKMPSELGQNIQGFEERLVPITEGGAEAARSVGNLFLAKYDFITYSSVLRCSQTANVINYSGTLKSIGDCAYLVSEYFGNLSQYNEKEKQIAIESLLNREDSTNIGLHQKMESIMNSFKANAKLGNGIYVTHDWWMALFLSYFTDLFYQDGYNIWPDFLEYFEIDFDRNEILFRNKLVKVFHENDWLLQHLELYIHNKISFSQMNNNWIKESKNWSCKNGYVPFWITAFEKLFQMILKEEEINMVPPIFLNGWGSTIASREAVQSFFKLHNLSLRIPQNPDEMRILYSAYPGCANSYSTYLLVKKLKDEFGPTSVYPDFYKNGGTLDWE